MTVAVRLILSGLCMFVPDADGKRMHALLPRAGRSTNGLGQEASGGHDQHAAHEPHFARVVYDVAHESPNSSGPSRRYRSVDVDGYRIEVAADARAPLECTLDSEQLLLLDERVCFTGARRAYHTSTAEGQWVTGRVVLRSGRASYCHGTAGGGRVFCTERDGPGLPARYTIEEVCASGTSREQAMAYAVMWHLGSFEAPVTLRRLLTLTPLSEVVSPKYRPGVDTKFDEVADRELRPLGGVLDLKVMHVVERELPSADGSMIDPSGNGTAHFDRYYDLAQVPPRTRPLPHLSGPRPSHDLVMGANCAVSQGRFST